MRLTLPRIFKKLEDKSGERRLFAEADRVRKDSVGGEVHLRGIIEFSNFCRCNCLYCGLRRDNKGLRRYRMAPEEIIACAKPAIAAGLRTIVLQSGEDPGFPFSSLCAVVEAIRRMGAAVTVSVGELPYASYRALRFAGADRYLLKFETSDARLYRRMKPDSTLARRLRCLGWLKKLGYETGSGAMIGLPGQSVASMAGDICLYRKLDLDMIGTGPFIPHHGTPLASFPAGGVDLVLRAVALTRLLTKDSNIPATTALETLDPAGREKALRCGANVVMPNMTPAKYRKLYEIYPGKNCSCPLSVRCALARIGRRVSDGRGDRIRK